MNSLFQEPSSTGVTQEDVWPAFLRKVAGTLGTRGVLLVVAFLSSIVTSRYLGPEGRGTYVVLTMIAAMGVQLGNFGLHAANTFFLSRDRALHRQIVSNSAWVSGLLGCTIVLVLIVARPLLSPAQAPPWLYYAAIAGIPFALFYLLALNIWLGLGQVAAFNRIEIVGHTAAFAAVLICLVGFGLGAGSLVVYLTSFNVLAAAWMFAALGGTAIRRFDLSLFAKMFRYGIKAYISAIFAFLVLRFDLLMVSQMIGTDAAGVYSIAVQMADVLYLLPVSIGTVLFPQISSMRSGEWNFTKRAARVTAWGLGSSALAVWFMAPLLIEFAYGSAFRESANALRWLLPGIWALGVNTVFMNYFAGTGMPAITFISPAVALFVNIALNLVLIPTMGVAGASLASTIAYSMMLGSSALYLTFNRKTL
jgi:O-antigen/teichoic acid export membrane protein